MYRKGNNMIATRQMDIRANLKKYFDYAFNGEPVIVSRKENKNVVVISEKEYNDLLKAKRNAEYLAKLDKSREELEQGKTISFSMDELRQWKVMTGNRQRKLWILWENSE